jgi:hypothetical protein
MDNTTTPTILALESITPEFLRNVSGGCGKKRCCNNVQQTQIIQLPPPAPTTPLPQAMPQCQQSQPDPPSEVKTEVYIGPARR